MFVSIISSVRVDEWLLGVVEQTEDKPKTIMQALAGSGGGERARAATEVVLICCEEHWAHLLHIRQEVPIWQQPHFLFKKEMEQFLI